MSRGWESKSVESAQEASQVSAQEAGPSNSSAAKPPVATAHLEEADRKRQRQALSFNANGSSPSAPPSPHRRTALTNALADIEEKLAELGWTIHF